MPLPFPDLVGKRFFRLLVTAETAFNKQGLRSYVCLCDCGNTTLARPSELRTKNKVSCGCKRSEGRGDLTTHGHSRVGLKTPEYKSWESMKKRCLCPTDINWERYGGRDITICERWMVFQNFFDDMGKRPSPQHSIERKDNDGNYEPSNCRWATKKEQARNRRSSLLVEYMGRMVSLAEACEQSGVNYDAAKYRVKTGKSFDKGTRTPWAERQRRSAS